MSCRPRPLRSGVNEIGSQRHSGKNQSVWLHRVKVRSWSFSVQKSLYWKWNWWKEGWSFLCDCIRPPCQRDANPWLSLPDNNSAPARVTELLQLDRCEVWQAIRALFFRCFKPEHIRDLCSVPLCRSKCLVHYLHGWSTVLFSLGRKRAADLCQY